MKKIIYIIVGLFITMSWGKKSFAQQEESNWFVQVGEVSPEFDLNKKDGNKEKISDHRGKVVMINFFATWCPPCRAELPRVQEEIWNKYKDHPEFELFVLGREENWDVLDPFIEKSGYTFPILPDADRSIFDLFAPQSIPRNVILDREGKVIYQSIGYTVPEFDNMLKIIEKAVEN